MQQAQSAAEEAEFAVGFTEIAVDHWQIAQRTGGLQRFERLLVALQLPGLIGLVEGKQVQGVGLGNEVAAQARVRQHHRSGAVGLVSTASPGKLAGYTKQRAHSHRVLLLTLKHGDGLPSTVDRLIRVESGMALDAA